VGFTLDIPDRGQCGCGTEGDPAGQAQPLALVRRFLWAKSSLASPLPGIVAGAILCFILAMNAYAKPVLLGGDSAPSQPSYR
jgi:hypothetical protein